MYSLFIGSDVSKLHIDISFKELVGKIIYLGRFSNSIEGYKSLIKELSRYTETPKKEWFVCFENTGVYSKALLNWLQFEGISCKEENALMIYKSAGMKRGKSDKIDSADITGYVFEKRDSITPTRLAMPEITRLKHLLSRRDFLVRQRQSCQISIKESKGLMDADLAKMFTSQNQKMINLYSDHIKAIEEEIENSIKAHEVMHENYKLTKSVVSVGAVIAAYFIANTDNFTSFNNARQFASYSGVAPFPNQSGSRKGRSKVSQLANKKIKSLLSNAAISAVTFDKQINTYYKKKIEEGKPKGVVYNAIKNKIIQRIFAVENRQSPYVQLNTYA